MPTITVEVCGDIWVNPDAVSLELDRSDIDQPIEIDLKSEGPSLKSMGIIQLLDNHCQSTGRDISTVTIIKHPNLIEEFPYARTYQGDSHFFAMSRDYWREPPGEIPGAVPFGFFIGRRTISRAAMIYHCWRDFRDQFLFSLMLTNSPLPWIKPSAGLSLEKINDWLHLGDFRPWWSDCPVTSIDGHTVRDQYISNSQTNTSILDYYNRFRIELVTETYTLGETFFPTEKTVRPIMAAKPMIIYGPRHFLKNLRGLGFRTWHRLWDESYDDFEGPERWVRMAAEIGKISQWPVERLDEAKEIAIYNRTILENLLNRL